MVIKKVLDNLKINCDEAENGLISVDFHKEGRKYDLIQGNACHGWPRGEFQLLYMIINPWTTYCVVCVC